MLHTACPSGLPDRSSDPFADLASSTEAFAREFREFMNRNPRPAPGSPADEETQGEPLAGDWYGPGWVAAVMRRTRRR